MTVPVQGGRWLRASTAPLGRAYDALLVDLDGVTYRGDEPVPHAADALTRARGDGLRIAFVTNNASRRPAQVVERLVAVGVAATEREVVTSAQAAARVLAERLPAGAPVLVVGADGLRHAITEVGLTVVMPGAGTRTGIAAVAQGLNEELTYADLAEACLAIRAGALWVAGNADATLPTDRGLLPGNGAFVAALRCATDAEPLVVGKPEPELHAEAVRRVAATHPLVVGDRLDTDIEGAVRAGADSLLVLTGVARPVDLLAAPEHRRPTYVAADLRGLSAAHEAPAHEAPAHEAPAHEAAGPEAPGGRTRCGAFVVDLVDDAYVLRVAHPGPVDDIDALRALCAAIWSSGPGDPGARAIRAGDDRGATSLAALGLDGPVPATASRGA